jgi:hypothetical protein
VIVLGVIVLGVIVLGVIVLGVTALADLTSVLATRAHLGHRLCPVEAIRVGGRVVEERRATSRRAERDVFVTRRTEGGIVDGHSADGIEQLGHGELPPEVLGA